MSQPVSADMPSVAEMSAMLGAMRGPEADVMKNMLEMMQSGDPQIQKQMAGYWKMLNGMAESNSEEYKQFIDSQMKEMNDHLKVEREKEEEMLSVESQPHFCFQIRPAKIVSE